MHDLHTRENAVSPNKSSFSDVPRENISGFFSYVSITAPPMTEIMVFILSAASWKSLSSSLRTPVCLPFSSKTGTVRLDIFFTVSAISATQLDISHILYLAAVMRPASNGLPSRPVVYPTTPANPPIDFTSLL